MPSMRIETNVVIPQEKKTAFLKECSAVLSRVTGKAEKICQVVVADGTAMIIAGEIVNSAHVEVKGINFPEENAAAITKEVCSLLENSLDIAQKHIYITCSSFAGAMWGCAGKTF